ncbi:MAG: DUF2207 domain-containing protein [Tenericutes bacterium]|nr:DUF2207 domain-containing protein [Mycoplasmatota bacterium]
MATIKIVFYIIMVLWYMYYIYLFINLYLNNSKPYDCDKVIDVKNVVIPLEDLSLIIYKKIKPEVLTATIVKLINNRKIKLEKNNDDFTLICNCHDSDLSKIELNIMELLFAVIGKDDKVTIRQINNFCTNNSGSSSFLMNYEIWKKLALVSSNKNKIFEPKLDYNKVKLVQSIGIILFILNIILKLYSFIGFFIIIPSILITIYFYNISKLTKEYSDYYYSFLNFRGEIRENPELLKNNIFFEYSIILKSYDAVSNIDKKEFAKRLDRAINKCYTNSVLYGNRSLFRR